MKSMASTSQVSFGDALRAAYAGIITREIASRLIRAREGHELESLMAAAARLRDQLKGKRITYSKKVFIPLTNLCRDYCGYCTFRKDPDQAGAHTMTPDE